ncbi:MAG: hypothetical protein H6581_29780 [Bacteroidia bacterium]|nr:hypothetical protein [Bacteroidia bacterium]
MKKHLFLTFILIGLLAVSCAPKQEQSQEIPALATNAVSTPASDAVQEGPWEAMAEAYEGLDSWFREVMDNMKSHEFLKVQEACDADHFNAQVTEGGMDGETYLVEMFNLSESLAEVPPGPLYTRLEQIQGYTVTDFYEVEGDGFDYTVDGYFVTAKGKADFTVNIMLMAGIFYLIAAYG